MKRVFLSLSLFCVFCLASSGRSQDTVIKNVSLDAPSSKTLRDVWIKNESIHRVGFNIAAPAGANIIDAKGLPLTCGFFSPYSELGLSEISAVEQSNDYRNTAPNISAAFSPLSSFNPLSSVIPYVRSHGITRVFLAPASNHNIVSGLGSVVHLGSKENYVLSKDSALILFLDLSARGKSGSSRSIAFANFLNYLDEAEDYARNKVAFNQRRRRDYALPTRDLEALLPAARGQIPILVWMNRFADIKQLIKIKQQRPRLRFVLMKGAQSHMLAKELAAYKIPVILNPLDNLPQSFDELGASLNTPALLHKAGVTVAFTMTGWGPHMDIKLRQIAGNAAAHGLPWAEALKAITLNPAKIHGIDQRYGSIEVSKDADLVLWSGDPLDVTSYVKKLWIKGQKISLESRNTKLRDRYLELRQQDQLPYAYR